MEWNVSLTSRLDARLRALFGIGPLQAVSSATGSVLSENFVLQTASGKYFLKQYRSQINPWIYEIKRAEFYFAEYGLPVLLPLEDAGGRTGFWFEAHWYSLFPFREDGIRKHPDQLTVGEAEHLGRTLARFHRAGSAFRGGEMPIIKSWSPGAFFFSYHEIVRVLSDIASPTLFDHIAQETLARKKAFVTRNALTIEDFSFLPQGLLHGDFHVGNVFFDAQGQVSAVFDFEKIGFGRPAAELARALMICHFDHRFTPAHEQRARSFLNAYRSEQPLSFEEFFYGMCFFRLSLFHLLWIEVKHYLRRSDAFDAIYLSHVERVAFFLKTDVRAFCERLYG